MRKKSKILVLLVLICALVINSTVYASTGQEKSDSTKVIDTDTAIKVSVLHITNLLSIPSEIATGNDNIY